MVRLCIWQLFWTLVISWFLTSANANMHNFTFFSPNLHAPCTPRYRFYFFFMIGFNFIGLFNLSLLNFCTCLFQLHFVIVSVTLAPLSYFNISKLCVFAFCFNFYLFFILSFEFYVVINVLVGMTVYGHFITQYGLLHHLFSLLESLVSLTLQSPSIFRFYVSASILNNQASNVQQSKTSSSSLSSPLIDYTGMIRSPSINITLRLCMGFCLMISFMGFSMRLGDGGRGVDDKSRISCGFGILFSLQISSLTETFVL